MTHTYKMNDNNVVGLFVFDVTLCRTVGVAMVVRRCPDEILGGC
jgi:hypothetical protein